MNDWPSMCCRLRAKHAAPLQGMSMLPDSASLHRLPAYSYLAKPFEPPGSQASHKHKQSTAPSRAAARDAASDGGSSRAGTPTSSATEKAPKQVAASLGAAMSAASSTALAGMSQAQIIASLPEHLMPPRPASCTSALKAADSGFSLSGQAPSRKGLGQALVLDFAAAGAAGSEGLPRAATPSFAQQQQETDAGLAHFIKSLSAPEVGSASAVHAMRKGFQEVACPTMPMLPSPQPGWMLMGPQSGQPVSSMAPAAADNPELQVGILHQQHFMDVACRHQFNRISHAMFHDHSGRLKQPRAYAGVLLYTEDHTKAHKFRPHFCY